MNQNKTVDFYYDYGSPTAYLAWTQLPALCERHDATLNYRPILLGGIFKATGNSTPAAVPLKGAWLFDDVVRYAAHYGVRYKMNPFFIVNTLTVMRGAMWAANTGCLERYNKAVFEATWADELDTSDPVVIAEILTKAGLDANALKSSVADATIKKQLIEATDTAVQRGVFGAPTMFVGDEMHFGQDRLSWVERHLAKA